MTEQPTSPGTQAPPPPVVPGDSVHVVGAASGPHPAPAPPATGLPPVPGADPISIRSATGVPPAPPVPPVTHPATHPVTHPVTRPLSSSESIPAPPVIAAADRPSISGSYTAPASGAAVSGWGSRRPGFTRRAASNPARSRSSAKDERLPLPAGTVVGDYTISSKIGIGGFGITYFATHTKEGTPVAIKEHLPAGLGTREPNTTAIIHTSPEQEARFKATLEEFQEEVTVLQGLSHPGIIPILSAFTANGTAYYVMPFQDGAPMSVVDQSTLDSVQQAKIARHNKRLLLSMLNTLDYLRMHQVVHRDIKTDNILVTPEGNTVLLDFGSARQLQPGKVFTNVYTPEYCAPEQSRSRNDEEMSETIGPWTDIYALGVCFYYLLTHLFPPRSDMRVIATADPYTPLAERADLEKLYGINFLRAIDRALELKIADRWQSAHAWRLAIEEGVVTRNPRVTRRMRLIISIFTVVLVVLSGISIWALNEKERAERSIDNSMRFVESMLNDFNSELKDIPGSTHLQRIFGEHLNAFLKDIEAQESGGEKDEKLISSLTSSWRNYGSLCFEQGKLEEADTAYGHADSYLQRLLALQPENNARRYDLACVLLRRVEIARSRNQPALLKRYLTEAQKQLQILTDAEPANPDYAVSAAGALYEEARVARSEDRTEEYHEAISSMLDTYRYLEDRYPDYLPVREGLGTALESYAHYVMQQGDLDSALGYLDEAKSIFIDLSRQYRYRLSYQKGLANVYFTLGRFYRIAGAEDENDDRALDALHTCIELTEYLESQDEHKAEYTAMTCQALLFVARIMQDRNRPNLAEAYCNTILRKTDKLCTTAPDNISYALMRSSAWRILAQAHAALPNHAAKTAEDYAEYRRCLEKIIQQSRDNLRPQYLYAQALEESAQHGLTTGQVVQARLWLEQAESILTKLAKLSPSSIAYTNALKRIQSELKDLTTKR